jgi:DnaK suppressor protein
MATRTTKKQSMKKPLKKKEKTASQKTSIKKPLTAARKTKKVLKKTVTKKTPLKTTLTTTKTKKRVPKKTARKKIAVKTKPVQTKQKTVEKRKKPVATPVQNLPVKKSPEDIRKDALRKTLIAKRAAIMQEAKTEISKYIKGETRQLVDTALDDGDWSVVDLSEDISLRQLSAHRENLQKIDEAIRKLEEGTYGICEDCGEEISEQRLKILPFAIYCIDCQENRELMEEMDRRA